MILELFIVSELMIPRFNVFYFVLLIVQIINFKCIIIIIASRFIFYVFQDVVIAVSQNLFLVIQLLTFVSLNFSFFKSRKFMSVLFQI